jgi:transitional endoplasmic reticulum ATPase
MIEDIRVSTKNILANPQITDLYGTASEFVKDFISSTEGEKVFSAMGVSPDKCFLLQGPPGVGKSMSISALNNSFNLECLEDIVAQQEEGVTPELDQDLIKLWVFEYSIGKYGTAYINQGSRNVQTVFDTAGLYARMGKNVLLSIDEADSLLGSRKSNLQSHSEDRKILETLMTNLQNAHDTPGFYVTLMTNTPEDCDPASLRSGRVDKTYTFNLPNPEERKLAIQGEIHNINRKAGYKVIRGYKTDNLVELSEGFNYADIVNYLETAVRQRAREVLQDRTNKIIPAAYVTGPRLEQAFKSKETVKSRKIGF